MSVLFNLKNKFSYKAMKELTQYLSTYNCATQAVAMASGTTNLASTALVGAVLNGTPMNLAAHSAAAVPNAPTETAWADATAYATVGTIRFVDGERFRSILAHTSSALRDKPRHGTHWAEYWEAAPHDATHAKGVVVTASYDVYMVVLADKDGALSLWLCGKEAATGEAVCKVPRYDAKMYVAIATVLLVNSTGAMTIGTTNWDDNCAVTIHQIMGHLFPHPDNFDAN